MKVIKFLLVVFSVSLSTVLQKTFISLLFLLFAIASFAEEQGVSQFEYIMTKHKDRIEQRQMSITENLNNIRIRGVINLLSPLTFGEVINIRNVYKDYEKFRIGIIYTEAHRQRILEVLNDEWPEWELEAITQNLLELTVTAGADVHVRANNKTAN